MEKIAVAPITLRQTLLQLIDDEIAHAKAGRPAAIWAKLNSLVDAELIDALYRATQAGVKIELSCAASAACGRACPACRRTSGSRASSAASSSTRASSASAPATALPSRKAKVFISSADWMPRNLDRRVETLVPIENPTVHQQVLDQIMVANLKDDAQSWILQPDGELSTACSRRRNRLQRASPIS